MVLVDTSVWVDHLRAGSPTLTRLLSELRVFTHEYVIGEHACGSLKNRPPLYAAAEHAQLNREFNQDTTDAKKAAAKGPVFITDRGRPSHVLLTIDEYRRLTSTEANLADLISMPEDDDIEFTPPKPDEVFRPAGLS